MKKLYFLFFCFMGLVSFGQDLLITGVIDGPLPGGNPKGVELYVVNNIPDLSIYGLESTTNGQAAAGVEWSFPADAATAGSYIYVGNTGSTAGFQQYLGVTPNYENSVASINGNDTVILYLNGAVEDSIGEIGVDGTGTAWDHLDGWAYRIDGNGPNATFDASEWTFSGADALDGCDLGDDTGTNAGCSSVFPVGTYSPVANTNPTITITSPNDGQALSSGTTTVDIEFSIQNAPGATVNISVAVNGGAPSNNIGVTSPFAINGLVDGDNVAVSVDLVDGGVLDSDNANFSIEFPCTFQIGSITETCDNITPASNDTYTATLTYVGGGNSDYTIDTGGIGVIGGDDPDSITNGTIVISNITEGTDFTVTIAGDPTDSSCNFTLNINSPDCDPQLTLPLLESFTYADGALTANPNWSDYSGVALQMTVTSGEVSILQDGSLSEDASIAFAGTGGENIFYSIDFRVPNPGGPVSGGDYEYFACFKDDSFGLRARIDIIEGTGGGDFTVGLATSGSTADVAWGSDLSFDTTYRATVRYNQDTNVSELWIDASAQTDTSVLGSDQADPGTTISEFALRQSNSSTDETIIVDNLIVAATFNQTLSTTDVDQANNFNLYPNPANTGFVTISSTTNDVMNVQVFDILGKEVKNETITNHTLDVSSLTTGMYLVKITQNNTSTTKKLVIR